MYVIRRMHRLTGEMSYACVNGWTRSVRRANYYMSKALARDALTLKNLTLKQRATYTFNVQKAA